MKKISIILISLIFGLSSCGDFLDINNNPNTPNESVPGPDLRLPPLITQTMDAYGSAATRCAFLIQSAGFYESVNSRYYEVQRWNMRGGDYNWAWQAWYVNAAVNIDPLITKATEVQAYHYEGAARFIKAFGFSFIAGMYGTAVYDDFAKETITPSYQYADYIYEQCLKELDLAIESFKKTQPASAVAFSKGDILAKGNTDIWIKACYGLKARLLNHMSGTPNFKATDVIAALNNAAKSNSDNLTITYVNNPADATSNLESLQYTNFSSTGRVGIMLHRYLMNDFPGGSKVIDPRRDTLIPMNAFSISKKPHLAARVLPVDVTSTFLPTHNKTTTDTLYAAWGKKRDGGREYGCLRGTFYASRESKAYIMPYHEVELIKAEVLFNSGDKAGAYTAYINAVRANMQELCVPEAKITQYLQSAAIPQSAGALSLSNIMREKYISCLYTVEPWFDMRKYNYSTNVFPGFNRPNAKYIWDKFPADAYPQRIPMATYETDYNATKLREAEPDYDKPSYSVKVVFPIVNK